MNPLALNPTYPDETGTQKAEVSDSSPGLFLPIENPELVRRLREKESAARKHFSELRIPDRAKVNRDFWRGKQYEDESRFDSWQFPYKDNVIYQDLEARITYASSRTPDIIVTPPNDNNAAIETAKNYEDALNAKVNNAGTQRLIKRGLRFHHLNFFAVAKGRWDPNLNNGDGDFIFELVRPERVLFDHTATIPDNGYTADNMDFIIEYLEEPVELVYAKFPGAANQLKAMIDQNAATRNISKLKYQEAWFTWYNTDGSIVEGTAWYYQDLVLDKQKNPYFDWDGYEVLTPNVNQDNQFKAKTPQKETRFYNYFERPRKPYMFFSYQNLDQSPVDDTTPVEQAIPIQRVVNRTGRQIIEISDNAVPKKYFAGKWITKEEVRRITSDPDENVWLDGADDATKAVTAFPPNPPPQELMQLQESSRQRIDALFSTHGTTRGESPPGDQQSGISKQISREGDLTMSDDLIDIVVERVMYEMAGWSTQFMKLFYDKPHFIKQMGQDGSMLYSELTRKDIQDGILVEVKASSVDKMTRRADAVNLASRKAIDPLTMYEDMDMANPKERTRRLLSFLNGTNDAFASYMAEIDVKFEHQNKTQPGAEGGDNASDTQAQTDLQNMVAGQVISPPDHFDAKYVKVFLDFVHSGQFDSLPADIKQNFAQYVQELQQNFQNFSTETGNNLAPGNPAGGVAPPGAVPGATPQPAQPAPNPLASASVG
jgi:hypothetical protein